MTQPVHGPRTSAAPSAGLTVATTGALIAWAEKHPTRSVARKGAQARELLRELRDLQAADEELTRANAEERRLLQELEAVRARKEQFRPRRKSPTTGYDQATVRAWARENGYTVAQRGSIPAPVVDAWRAAQNGGDR
ncbi:histone-like nucleoid-structuring protein Lsr2 [Streptomyces sp. NPDC005426]|uniref:Lsr2 family DNA-binding protein n=1 Tax=Streptomyces sp. NPDC005426 TaxID=3155344 RepID=UPI0033B44517